MMSDKPEQKLPKHYLGTDLEPQVYPNVGKAKRSSFNSVRLHNIACLLNVILVDVRDIKTRAFERKRLASAV